MDSRRASYFLAVADHGSFSAAARVLHLSQPALSTAVRELETTLGAPLFERMGRGVILTEAGQAFAAHARRSLAELEAGASAVREVQGLEGGTLALCCLATLASDPVAVAVGELRQRHPGVHIDLKSSADPEELVRMVRAGEAELGFTSLVRAPADLICVPAAPQELCAALVPGDVVIGPLSLEDLASRDLVALPQGASTRQSLQHAFDLAGLSPRIAVETEVRDALIPLVLAGAGAAVVPRHLAVMAAAQGATVVALSPPLERAVQLLHRPGARSAAATALLAIVTRSIEP